MKTKVPTFKIRPHINAEPHRRLMAEMRTWTPEQGRQSLIDAGIITKTGRLTKPYRELEVLRVPKKPMRSSTAKPARTSSAG